MPIEQGIWLNYDMITEENFEHNVRQDSDCAEVLMEDKRLINQEAISRFQKECNFLALTLVPPTT